MDSTVTGDFIFGTLGTEERRLNHELARYRGVWHGSRVTPLNPAPGDDITFIVRAGLDVDLEHMDLLLTRDGSDPGADSECISFTKAATEWSTLAWGYTETWICRVPSSAVELWRYRIRAVTSNGDVVWADTSGRTGEPGLFALSIDTEQDAPWLRDAVIYQVFVDRYAPSAGVAFKPRPSLMDIWGGTLRGVIEHLDHIQQLGATAIWLTPIFPSPSHHGYDATDYTSIEPRLGSMADFDDLLSEVHRRGMRLILDFVAGHTSNQHPAFLNALNDPHSPHRSMYSIHPDGSYETFFGVEEMPSINGDSEAALTWLLDAAIFWADKGVDGFRLDYAIGQSMQFWTRFRHALRATNPEFALIAEAVDSAQTLQAYQGRIDAVLDFLFLEQIRKFIGFELTDAEDFWRFMHRHLEWFEYGPITPTFLDNHDMNRMLWILQGNTDRLKLAALLQFALPSPPVIYYGTEVGLSQWHDLEFPDGSRRMEESRCPMLWGSDQDKDLLEFYRSLVFWRKRFRIAQNAPRLVHAGKDGVLIFTTGEWLVVINRNAEEQTIDLGSYGRMWLGLATSPGVKLYGAELVLPEYSGVVVANHLARA